MGRRIEVELTSTRDDGTWTWRAAGAKQPKGVLDAGLLYEGARVGDVVRAEADFEIEGILITSVLPPREKRAEPSRLEIIGPPREHQGVTSSLVPKSDRPRPERGRGRDRDGRDSGPGDRGRPAGADRRGGPSRPRDDGAGRAAGPRAEGRPRPEGRRPERQHEDRRPGAGRSREGGGARSEGREREGRERRPAAPPAEPAAPKPKRLAPANVHRAAALESLAPEQRAVAEQVLRGGIPAVRQAIDAQNARLREEGQSEVKPGPLVALAEQLLPLLKAAEWRDRAEAAAKVVDEVSLRDLRSVVAGADSARDDEARLLAGTLRQALERRVNEQRDRWVTDITGALDEGRLVRALRLSAHPPDPSTRFPADLALRLGEAAGAAMTADVTPDRWGTLLEAVAESPVRRSVKPVALPTEPGEPLLHAARQASGRVPALAALLGISMPPPPGPPRTARPAPRGSRPPGQPGGKRRPPAPGGREPQPAGADKNGSTEAAPAAPVDSPASVAPVETPPAEVAEAPVAPTPAGAPAPETAEPPAPTVPEPAPEAAVSEAGAPAAPSEPAAPEAAAPPSPSQSAAPETAEPEPAPIGSAVPPVPAAAAPPEPPSATAPPRDDEAAAPAGDLTESPVPASADDRD